MKFLTTLALCAVLALSGCTTKQVATLEQKATHEMVWHDNQGRADGQCTATAIGPHALLTADHCNPQDILQYFTLDMSIHVYRTVAVAHDARDHAIYIIDGPAFKNYVTVKATMAVPGEKVHMYGNGDGRFISRRLDGTRVPEFDPSDVDEAEGNQYFSLKASSGDSGAAVYNEAGEMVAILTYSLSSDETPLSHSAGFSLNFSDKNFAYAQNYDPK